MCNLGYSRCISKSLCKATGVALKKNGCFGSSFQVLELLLFGCRKERSTEDDREVHPGWLTYVPPSAPATAHALSMMMSK
jgi:hypothetical protein